jgi:hypothetical protein
MTGRKLYRALSGGVSVVRPKGNPPNRATGSRRRLKVSKVRNPVNGRLGDSARTQDVIQVGKEVQLSRRPSM